MSEPLDVILQGDALETLKTLPDGYVNTIVTSPPYFALRDYGVDGQMGLESTPQEYLARMTAVFREARRVLRDDGVLWMNMGDSYAGGGNYRGINSEDTLSPKQRSNGGARGISQLLGARDTEGIASKNLLGMPWRLAFALQDDGWILRSDCIWAKPNPMPESVTDRPTKSHEYVFLFSKAPRYWYDADAVREKSGNNSHGGGIAHDGRYMKLSGRGDGERPMGLITINRNLRTVWSIPTEPTSEAHFATYPQKLVERCILAGCPDKVCAECGKPWVRDVERGEKYAIDGRKTWGHGDLGDDTLCQKS